MKKLSKLIILLFSVIITEAQIPCSLDNSFAGNGRLISDLSYRGEQMVVLPDGKILVACNPEGNGPAYIKRFNTDGTVDNTYGVGGKCNIIAAEVFTRVYGMLVYNNQLFVCGNTQTYIGGVKTYPFAAAVTGNGAMLATFGTNGIKTLPTNYGIASGITADNAGNLYICGYDYKTELFVAKLTQTGAYDLSFDGDGIASVLTGNNDHSYRSAGIKTDKNNRIVISGKKCRTDGSGIADFRKGILVRLLQSGAPDNTFANNGILLYNNNASSFDQAQDIHILPNNDYIVCGDTYDGTDYDFSVLKIKNNGTIDAGFGNAGWQVHDLEMNNDSDNPVNSALLPDGRILMTGRTILADTVYFALLMMNADGTRDVSFAPNGVFKNVFALNNTNWSRGLGIAPDGKIVLAGHTQTCANAMCGPYHMAISRYNSNFAPTGIETILQEQISMYPNPAGSGQMIVVNNQSGIKIQQVRLTDITGRTQFIFSPGEKSFSFNMNVVSGLYLCTLETESGSITKKILVR